MMHPPSGSSSRAPQQQVIVSIGMSLEEKLAAYKSNVLSRLAVSGEDQQEREIKRKLIEFVKRLIKMAFKVNSLQLLINIRLQRLSLSSEAYINFYGILHGIPLTAMHKGFTARKKLMAASSRKTFNTILPELKRVVPQLSEASELARMLANYRKHYLKERTELIQTEEEISKFSGEKSTFLDKWKHEIIGNMYKELSKTEDNFFKQYFNHEGNVTKRLNYPSRVMDHQQSRSGEVEMTSFNPQLTGNEVERIAPSNQRDVISVSELRKGRYQSQYLKIFREQLPLIDIIIRLYECYINNSKGWGMFNNNKQSKFAQTIVDHLKRNKSMTGDEIKTLIQSKTGNLTVNPKDQFIPVTELVMNGIESMNCLDVLKQFQQSTYSPTGPRSSLSG